MFTGIIQAIGRIEWQRPQGGDVRLCIQTGDLDMGDVALGDSIAVAGVCLTVVAFDTQHFEADVSRETLQRTALGGLGPGSPVNLEKALRLADRLGGHLVSGHVDGTGRLLERQEEARSTRMRFSLPAELARYVAAKGSITIDGISLTVNTVEETAFGVNIVPHTLTHTTLGGLQPGQTVNLEVDLLARYLERLLHSDRSGDLNRLLKDSGFLPP